MKKIIVLMLCVLCAVSFIGCPMHDPMHDPEAIPYEPPVDVQPDEDLLAKDLLENDQWDEFSSPILFTTESNTYTELLETGPDAISMIFDLDNDGINEAIVCVVDNTGIASELQIGEEMYYLKNTNQHYYLIRNAYFISDDNTIEEMCELAGVSILQKQRLTVGDNQSYLALNGYYENKSCGEIVTVSEDKYVNITGDLFPNGHKYFSGNNEIVWYKSFYGGEVQYEAGMSLYDKIEQGQASDLARIPYYYTVDGLNIKQYSSRVVTADEVSEIAEFDFDEYADAYDCQFILASNGNLYVNVATKNTYIMLLHCYVYQKGSKSWNLTCFTDGFAVEDATGDPSWELLTKIN